MKTLNLLKYGLFCSILLTSAISYSQNFSNSPIIDNLAHTEEESSIKSYVSSKHDIYLDVDQSQLDQNFGNEISGIGRDDSFNLYLTQSNNIEANYRNNGILSIRLHSNTNANSSESNTKKINNKAFLVWGNNGVDLNKTQPTVTKNISSGISSGLTTNVEFKAISRIWKFVESGGDIPTVEIEILKNNIKTKTQEKGHYLMLISDTPTFNSNVDYKIMSAYTNTLGKATLNTKYNFNGTKYITFGWSPEVGFERSIFFNPLSNNYIDVDNALDINPSGFTISTWLKREATTSLNTSILSKRNEKLITGVYTEGYDFTINAIGRFEVNWVDSESNYRSITSSVEIPANKWHHLAIIHDGAIAKLYIDGVEDTSATLPPPTNTNQSFYIGAAAKDSPQNFFHGYIDEVRIWDDALSEDQLRFMMNQEIESNNSFVSGKYFNHLNTIPTKNDVGTLPWNKLAAYYPMSNYTFTNTMDESGKGNHGALINLITVDTQTAPIPYQSAQNGQWNSNDTWENGDEFPIPGTTSIVDNTISIDWNIVRTSHNILVNDDSDLPINNNGNRTVLALIVDENELTLSGDTNYALHNFKGYALTVTHYLNLNGKIDLEGESQLIQSIDSDLNTSDIGALERDQQGSSDLYTYKYWSSPVGETSQNDNGYSYSVQGVMYDNDTPIDFITSGYDGANTNPIGIADYWVWKYASIPFANYSSWQHIRRSGTIYAGEGFTMKGPGSGASTEMQNYVFRGKPNNGPITLTINADNDYLIGNPYPSALNARQFILDNGNNSNESGSITGTLYFWEHWSGGSHGSSNYQGGYALYNLSGGTPSPSYGSSNPTLGTEGLSRKRPGQYIPVSQGFFVSAQDNGGTINFNNGQRAFQKESASSTANSTFIRSSNTSTDESIDQRMKFRIGFYSTNTIQRQLLLTIDSDATVQKDWGYDGAVNDIQMDDMYWVIEDEKFIIQGTNEANDDSIYPLGIIVNNSGTNYISINELENVTSDITVYLHDKELELYHDLTNNGDYEVYLHAGEYNERFEITFNNEDSLSLTENALSGVDIYYVNDTESIVLRNPKNIEIKSIEMFNLLGQAITSIKDILESGYSEYQVKNLSSGTYIIKLYTASGSVSKKVIVK